MLGAVSDALTAADGVSVVGACAHNHVGGSKAIKMHQRVRLTGFIDHPYESPFTWLKNDFIVELFNFVESGHAWVLSCLSDPIWCKRPYKCSCFDL
jgi:hypothetical protein